MRSINWLDSTERALQALFPDYKAASHHVTERLTTLLLDRLPRPLAEDLLDLLPEDESRTALALEAQTDEDASIGYPDFIEKAEQALGSTGLGVDPAISHEIADAYLWAVVHEIPPDMKYQLIRALPLELRSRMDLYSASSDDAKVA
jgi:hypothetical protein